MIANTTPLAANEYEKDKAERKLLMKLQEAEDAVKEEKGWMSLDELKAARENINSSGKSPAF